VPVRGRVVLVSLASLLCSATVAAAIGGCTSATVPQTPQAVPGSATPATSAPPAPPAPPGTPPRPPAELADVPERYRAYALDQARQLQDATRAFTAAIRQGDLAAAQARYAPTRASYERLEPVAELFEDLDTSIDSRVEAHSGPDDPEWTGFHRLELALFEQRRTDGLAPLADRLDADIANLGDWVRVVPLPTIDVVKGARELLEEVARTKITGEEDRYSHTDLSDFQANVDGSQEVWSLVAPAVMARDADLAARLAAGFTTIDAALAPYRHADGTFATYDALAPTDRQRLAAEVAAQSESLALLPGVLGL
jgi:iron uptake system component EfeO